MKMYGNTPIKLLNRINENIEISITSDPFGKPWPKIILNSLNSETFIVLRKTIVFEETAHTDEDTTSSAIANDIQLSDTLEEVEGSKIENRLVIIFIFFHMSVYMHFL